MSKPPIDPDMRDVRLEALIRKALADAWAQGVTSKEADSMAVQVARAVFPDMAESEICSAIEAVRR